MKNAHDWRRGLITAASVFTFMLASGPILQAAELTVQQNVSMLLYGTSA